MDFPPLATGFCPDHQPTALQNPFCAIPVFRRYSLLSGDCLHGEGGEAMGVRAWNSLVLPCPHEPVAAC